MKLDFNDILLTPAPQSGISSRYQDIKLPHVNGKVQYPLFAAPMDTVVSEQNFAQFLEAGIKVCLPRTVKTIYPSFSGQFFNSVSLTEFKDGVPYEERTDADHVLIDIANGHLSSLVEAIKEIKKIYPHLTIMAGNVANPETFVALARAGADYVRVGIGGGAGCLTTVQLGVGYPMASLVYECYLEKSKNNLQTKIVADGGMKTYSDIIKALALGADYVMIGSIFNKLIESAGDSYFHNLKVPQSIAQKLYKKGFKIQKKFRGMSTKEAQKAMGQTQVKTSEGVVRIRTVESDLKKWMENFDHYLRSAMSYCNAATLEQFIGQPSWNTITPHAYQRFQK